MAYVEEEPDGTFTIYCGEGDCPDEIDSGYGFSEDAEAAADAHEEDHDLADYFG